MRRIFERRTLAALTACHEAAAPSPTRATSAQALTLTAELELNAAATQIGEPAGDQTAIVVANIASSLLNVWEDTRYGADDPRILGAWFSNAGSANPVGTPIVLAPGTNLTQTHPQVAGGTAQYLVVYARGVLGEQDIEGVWVSNANGQPGTPFTIAASVNSEGAPVVAANPGATPPVFAVVWQDVDGVGPLKAVLLQEGSTTPTAGPTTIADGPANEEVPSLAFNGTNFIVGWKDARAGTPTPDLYFMTFSSTSLPASPSTGVKPFSSGGYRLAPSLIGGNTGQSLLLFLQAGAADASASRLNGTTALNAQPGIDLFPGTLQNEPTAYYDSAQSRYRLFLPAGSSSNIILDNQLSSAGTLGVQGMTTVSSNVGSLVASHYLYTGLAYAYLAWNTSTLYGTKLRSLRFDSFSYLTLAQSEVTEQAPSAATFASSTEALVAWQQAFSVATDAGTTTDVAFRVYRADGGHSAPNVLALQGPQGAPSVAAIGQRAMVAFNDVRLTPGRGGGGPVSVNSALVDSTNPSSPTLVKIADPTEGPVVAGALGGQFFVAWPETTSANVRYTLVKPNATSTDGGFNIVSTGSGLTLAQAVSLAFAGQPGSGGLLSVAIGQALSGPYEVRALRMTDDAGFSAPLLLASNGAGDSRRQLVATDFDGTNFVVAWVDGRNGVTAPDLYAARVSAAGTLLDPSGVAIDTGPDRPRDVALSFDGRHHVLAAGVDLLDGGTDVVVHVLRPDLSEIFGTAVATAEPEKQPALTPLGDAGTLIAFTRSKLDAVVAANRAFALTLTVGLGDPCTGNADCHSGFCSGGVCCDSVCNGACETCLMAQGSKANGTCGPLPAASPCRGAAGVCDLAELCDGVSAACPPDQLAPATTVCRAASANGCDVAETCTGTSVDCPADRFADAGATCSSIQACAGTAHCDGVTDVCPSVGLKQAGTTCRPADGGCDIEEQCDGMSQACPPDLWRDTTVTCRPSAGFCDVEEKCTGNSPNCPADVVVMDNRVCRMGASSCDVEERCNGAGPTCPDDRFVPDGGACTDGTGICVDAICQQDAATKHEGSPYSFGCGCGAAGGPSFLLVLAAWLMRRRRSALAAVVCAAVLAAASAFAQGKPPRLIFQTVRPGSGVSPETAGTVTEYVHSELSSLGAYEVIGQNEIAAIVGVERQKQLMGCSDESGSCFAELSGALNADRMVVGDISRVDDLALLNLSLIDLKDSKPIARVGRKVSLSGSKLGPLFDEVKPMLIELLQKDPSNKGKSFKPERTFGGFVIGIAGNTDVLGPNIAPALTAELSGRWVGGALTVLPKATFGARLEARFYPVVLGLVRPFIAAGVTAFTTELGIRGAIGASIRIVYGLQAFIDAGYERFVVQFAPASELFNRDAVILGFGLGWQV